MPYSNKDDKRDYDRARARVRYRAKKLGTPINASDIFYERMKDIAAETEAARAELRRDRRERERD